MDASLGERTLVLDVELAGWIAPPGGGLPAVSDAGTASVPAGDASAAFVLCRLHGRPVGYVTVPVVDGTVARRAVVEALIETQLPALSVALARSALDARGQLEGDVEGLLRRRPGGPDPGPRDHAGEAVAPLRDPASGSAHPRVPLVTVAVCTRNRPLDLDSCLAALGRLRYPALDLLVVDNAPTDGRTAAAVQRHPGVRYVVEPRPGLDWARNRAIAECRGEILAFTDDDVVVDPGWVDALVAVFENDPGVMAVTGLVLPLELDSRAQRLFEIYGGFARGARRRWHRARPGRPAALEFGGAGAFGTGANMAFRRRLFGLAGGFDPALDVGTCTNGGGDLEMFFRVLKHGHTLVYEPSAVVWHRHRRNDAALRTQIANNGIGFYAYLARTAAAYPDEWLAVLRLGVWWFAWWSLRRLVNRLRGREPVPLDLILAEIVGSLRGPFRYWLARRHARAAGRRYPGVRSVAAVPTVKPPARVLTREAVRRVELTEPLQPLTGLEDDRRVQLFVFRAGELVGRVVIDNRGAGVSVLQLRDAIAESLTLELIEGSRHPEPDRGSQRLGAAVRSAFQLAGSTAPSRVPAPSSPAGTLAGTKEAPLPPHVAVSVVLATYDRPEDLRACLASLVSQRTPRPLELIVVDNHPASGATPPVVAGFPGVRLVAEPRVGLSYARNRGILAASGDLILTTDDDVVCPPEWVETIVAPFARSHVMIVTGHVLPIELETRAQQLFETYGGLGRGYRAFEAGPDSFRHARLSIPTWRLGCTANAAFRASIFTEPRIGLMDEALGAGTPTGCSEDTYVFYRVLAAGFSIAYEPRAYVWHRHRRTIDALQRQLYSYSKGHVAYHLTTWLADGDRRALVRLFYELPVSYAQRTLLRLVRRSDYPLRFIALEVLGNLAGPWALWRSRRRVRRLGRSQPASPSTTLRPDTALTPEA